MTTIVEAEIHYLRQATTILASLDTVATPGPWRVAAEIDGMHFGRNTVLKAASSMNVPDARRRIVSLGQTRQHFDEPGVAEANIALVSVLRSIALPLAEFFAAEANKMQHSMENDREVYASDFAVNMALRIIDAAKVLPTSLNPKAALPINLLGADE